MFLATRIPSLGTRIFPAVRQNFLLQEKKSCGKKKIVSSLYQVQNSWRQKSFLWEFLFYFSSKEKKKLGGMTNFIL